MPEKFDIKYIAKDENKHSPENNGVYTSSKTFCPETYNLPDGIYFKSYHIMFGDDGIITFE